MAAQTHAHREAFSLMQYESDDGTVSRLIWNSRDGVTPFVATIGGDELRHVRWGEDVYAPGHQPADEDLVWITDHPSLDFWIGVMRKRVEMMPQYAPPEGPERDAFIRKIAESEMSSHGEEGTVALVTGTEWRRRQS